MIPGDILKAAKSSAKTAYMLSEIMGYLVQVPIRGAGLNEVKRRRFYSEQTSKGSRRVLGALGFHVEVKGFDPELMKNSNFLMVGNHMSYLDILMTASAIPIVFVTSIDMGQVPLLGRLAELGGSIFIERRHRGQVERDLKNMSDALHDGFNVMIYPEGTSTNGLGMLPFKKSLLMAAVEGGRDIMPVVLKYTSIDGEPFGPQNCDKVCWYGDMSFAPHFLQLMGLRDIRVTVEFLAPIKVTKDSTRQELAEKSYNAIHTAYFGHPPDQKLNPTEARP